MLAMGSSPTTWGLGGVLHRVQWEAIQGEKQSRQVRNKEFSNTRRHEHLETKVHLEFMHKIQLYERN